MRFIKRYSNRRLYDSRSSQVINLEDIANYIKEGEEVKVIDNTSGEDITAKVLAQTFLKLITDNKSTDFTIFLFSSLIREITSNLSRFLSRLIQGGIGTELLTPEKITKIVEEFIGKGELEIQEKEKYLNHLFHSFYFHKEQLKQKIIENLQKQNIKFQEIEYNWSQKENSLEEILESFKEKLQSQETKIKENHINPNHSEQTPSND